MLADAHAHIFASGFTGRYQRPCSGGDDLGIYESFRHLHEIGAALVVGFEGLAECAGNNAHILTLSARHKWMVPVAYVSPSAPSTPPVEFAGISLYLTTPDEARDFLRWPPGIQDALSSRAAVISLNVVPDTLAIAAPALRKLGGCRILISHLGDPGAHKRPPTADQAAKTLAPLISLANDSHVGVKLSGLYGVSDPPHDYPHAAAGPLIEQIVDAFGTDRLYWGSDFSPALDYVSFAQTIAAVSDLGWSHSEREAVMGGNLLRLLGLTAGG